MIRATLGAAIRLGLKWTILPVAMLALAAGAISFAVASSPDVVDQTPPNVLGQVLSPDDEQRYRRVFAHQQEGSWKAADREIGLLENRVLLGHVLAQRYLHPTRYRSRYDELADWLKRYGDHPDAETIHSLARKRKPPNAAPLQTPEALPKLRFSDHDYTPTVIYRPPSDRTAKARREAASLLRSIHRHAEAGRISHAEATFRQRRTQTLLNAVELDIARYHLGAGHYYWGNSEAALGYLEAAMRASAHLPYGHWMTGLAAFRNGSYAAAARHFESAAASGHFDRWDLSASAFWAGRAQLLAGRPDLMRPWFELALQHAHTFYGLLAMRVLGAEPPFDWSGPTLTDSALEALVGTPRGGRALALLQIGETQRAKEELRALLATRQPEIGQHVIALAEGNAMPALTLSAGAMLRQVGGVDVHSALYPLPPWSPERGFTLDRSLIYGFMRQESQFKIFAKSRSGARGLMQLMPATAGDMANRKFHGGARNELYDPELNIRLGQKYLRYLLGHEAVDGDILLLAAAYNGGPGNLARWRRHAERVGVNDPLLFIEMIPARETREFVERVAANLWIYRLRMGQQTPELDALAAGGRPIYQSLDAAGQSADVRY